MILRLWRLSRRAPRIKILVGADVHRSCPSIRLLVVVVMDPCTSLRSWNLLSGRAL